MTEAFSIVAALAAVLQACALVTLHFQPTGYDPVRDAVSDYGVGPYRGWFWLAVAGGVACLALGIALAQLHISGPRLHPFFGGLRARLLPVLDHLGADRRYRPRPDFRLKQS
jgi:Protein of unknown function (DUF998)